MNIYTATGVNDGFFLVLATYAASQEKALELFNPEFERAAKVDQEEVGEEWDLGDYKIIETQKFTPNEDGLLVDQDDVTASYWLINQEGNIKNNPGEVFMIECGPEPGSD